MDEYLRSLVEAGLIDREVLATHLDQLEFEREMRQLDVEGMLLQQSADRQFESWARVHDATYGTDVQGMSARLAAKTAEASRLGREAAMRRFGMS